MHTIAVILAGGAGNRMNSALPKQFMEVAGRPLIACAVEVFERHAGIDEIAVVVHPAFRRVWEDIAEKYRWQKIAHILDGGATRADSTMAALRAYANTREAYILLHDAARPLVAPRLIDDTLGALEHFRAVTTAIAPTDTLLQTDAAQLCVAHIPDRSRMRCVQTPQGFHLSVIRQAYAMAAADPGFAATDDCGVVHAFLPDEPVGIVPGDVRNVKITWPEDWRWLEEEIR